MGDKKMATRGEIEDYFLENYDTFEFLDFFYNFVYDMCRESDYYTIIIFEKLLDFLIDFSKQNNIDIINYEIKDF